MADVRQAAGSPAPKQESVLDYDAFLSYTQVDEPVAKGIQKGLHHIGKRLGQLRALRVFRDRTSLSANEDLWGDITAAMARANYLIVVLSPHAAPAPWVNREVSFWLETRGREKLLLVLADGRLEWDEHTERFDPQRSTAAPPVLTEPGSQPKQPLYIDVSTDKPWDHRSPVFRDKVTALAAPIHGVPKDQLASDDLREQRRFRRLRRVVVAGLVVLTVIAVVLSFVAWVQKRHADQEAQVALSRQLASTSATQLSINPRAALLLAASAYRINANPQTFAALMRADTANPQLVRYFDAGATVDQLVASRDGKTLVAGLADGRVIRWLLSDPTPATAIQLPSPVKSVALSASASVIVAADSHSAVLSRTGHDAVPLPLPGGLSVRAVALSPSGNTAVIDGCLPEQKRCKSSSDVVIDAAAASQRATYLGTASIDPVTGRASGFFASEGLHLVAPSDDELLLFDWQGWERRRLADWALTESGTLGLGAHQNASKPSADGESFAATWGALETPVSKLHGQIPDDSAHLTAQAPITSAGDVLALNPHATALAIADAGSIYVAPVAPDNAILPAPGSNAAPGSDGPTAETGPPIRAATVQLSGAGIITSVDRLTFVGDDSRLVSATGRYIALWDLHQIDRLAKTAQTALNSAPCNACGPTKIRVSPDTTRAALVASSALAVEPLPGNSGSPQLLPELTGIALWRKDGRLLLVRGAAKVSVQTAAGITAGGIQLFTDPGAERVTAAALAEAERSVVAVDSNGKISILKADNGELQDTIQGPTPASLAGNDDNPGTAISSAGDLVAVVTESKSNSSQLGGSLWIYDVENHQKIGSIPGDDITGVRFSGPLLLVQRAAGNLELWDTRGTFFKGVIAGDQRYIYPPAADTRGHLVARLRGENGIDLFDLNTGTLVDSIPPYPSSFRTGYSFSADGGVFVTDIARSPNAPSVYDVLVVRDLSPQALLQSACATAGGNLSPQEWQSLTGIGPAGIPTC